jgi:hypothetical protein
MMRTAAILVGFQVAAWRHNDGHTCNEAGERPHEIPERRKSVEDYRPLDQDRAQQPQLGACQAEGSINARRHAWAIPAVVDGHIACDRLLSKRPRPRRAQRRTYQPR